MKQDARKIEQAKQDYLRMGLPRSMERLCEEYRNRPTGPGTTSPPTRRLTTLKSWSSAGAWIAAAVAYDAERHRQEKEDEADIDRRLNRLRKETRLEVASAIREKAIEALRLLDPAALARRPQTIATLLALAGQEERRDDPPAPKPLINLSAEDLANRPIIILPSNDRDKPAWEEELSAPAAPPIPASDEEEDA